LKDGKVTIERRKSAKMSVVNEIKERLDIVDVVSDYVPLKKAGRNYKALCPFHSEKTPSFYVFPETKSWHCFGACSTGGDVFTFIMRIENLPFGDALRTLAQRAGVTLRQKSEEELEEERLKKRLVEINTLAADYFHRLLVSPQGKRAMRYLIEREINRETIERFKLGYSLDSWRALKDYLRSKGYKQDEIHAAGLVIEREGGGYYDRFRGRLMIPIRNVRGDVVGFGARALDDSTPKYLNSPQTPIFNKRSNLFGLDFAKEKIRTEGLAVIVEGYMDVLMAHQHGFENVVASMGTALTEEQLELLSRLTKKFALALDSDTAGDTATLRGIALAREKLTRKTVPVPSPTGIRYEGRMEAEISIISLPAGKDPDKVIREDPSLWAELVEGALPIVDYYFDVVTSSLDLSSPRGKSAAVKELLPVIGEIGDQIERAHYVQKLARLVRVDERTLLMEIKAQKADIEETFPLKETFAFGPEEHCLSTLIMKPGLLQRLDDLFGEIGVEGLNSEDFAKVENKGIFSHLREGLDEEVLREHLDKGLRERFDYLLEKAKSAPLINDERVEEDLFDVALRLRARRLRRLISELRFLLEEAREEESVKYGRMVDLCTAALRRVDRALASRNRLYR
jgi:DNA primase